MPDDVHLSFWPHEDGDLGDWMRQVAEPLGLESTLRPRGRPNKEPEK